MKKKSMDKNVSIFWMRRDLRIHDNVGLFQALSQESNVLPVFIFDTSILSTVENKSDIRVYFIWKTISELKAKFQSLGSDLLVKHGQPEVVFKALVKSYKIQSVYCNHDYEPQAIKRDEVISNFFEKLGIPFLSFKDQVLFEKNEIVKERGDPYLVFGAYKRKWIQQYIEKKEKLKPIKVSDDLLRNKLKSISKKEIIIQPKDFGFNFSHWSDSKIPECNLTHKIIKNYERDRDYPALEGTSHTGFHLRFGLVSPRTILQKSTLEREAWLSELIWREFFMQILYHFPKTENNSFRKDFDKINWRRSKSDFERWSSGQTGVPFVDAGIRELLTTGYMHNRVRMIVASFLTKNLLIHWKKGERFFSKHLLDFELSSNVGNWQWVAGSGCDAAPYFRIFNPEIQRKKFDPRNDYIQKWVPEYKSSSYLKPIIDHEMARRRALFEFQKALKNSKGKLDL